MLNWKRVWGCLFLIGFSVLFAASSVSEAGYWQQEPPVMIGVDDKPCVAGKWPDQNQWMRQVYDFGATHVTYGFYHPQVQQSWTQANVWWQAPPAVLYPKQQISFQYGVTLTSWSKWRDATVWLYRMSGPGGPDDQLGYASVQSSATYTTKVHVVPDGFTGEAPQEARLRYQMGATNACKTIFSYKWVSGESTSGGSTSGISQPQTSSVILRSGTTEAVQNGANPLSFRLNRPYFINSITTFHYNDGRGASAGNITLYRADGSVVGQWQAKGVYNSATPQEGAPAGKPELYWYVWPNIVLPAGSYSIVDSSPDTWASSPQTQGKGHGWITGYPQ